MMSSGHFISSFFIVIQIEMFHQEILHRDSLRKEDDPLLLSEEELRFAKE